MYLSTRLTAPRCLVVGASMNLLTYPTENARSGLEFTKYRSDPTMLL